MNVMQNKENGKELNGFDVSEYGEMFFDLLISNENKEANSILSSPLHAEHGGLMIRIHMCL